MNTEYELIYISIEVNYSIEDEPSFVSEDNTLTLKKDTPIEYDDNGIPMGNSLSEKNVREKMIEDFFKTWSESNTDRKIFNDAIQDYIYLRAISIIEAKFHSSKSYKSTLAVFMLDEVLKNAKPVRRVRTKKDNKNQEKFSYMLIMVHRHPEVGTIKLTVGVKSSEQHIQYGITALHPGQPLVDDTKNKKRNPRK